MKLLHPTATELDTLWAVRVHDALQRLYGSSICEFNDWMLPQYRRIADGTIPADERRDEIEGLRWKFGIAENMRVGSGPALWGDEAGFRDALKALMFLHALPMREDSTGRIHFEVKDYIALQEAFGDDGVLAHKVKIAGIAPEQVVGHHGTMSLTQDDSVALKHFMHGTPGAEKALFDGKAIAARRDLITQDQIKLDRYYSVLPHVVSQMTAYMQSRQSQIFSRNPEIVNHLAHIDQTPFEDGFAARNRDASDTSSRLNLYRKAIEEYWKYRSKYQAHPLDANEIDTRIVSDMGQFLEIFQQKMRAHMSIAQLHFKQHRMAGYQGDVLSIDESALAPFLKQCKVPSITRFFDAAGAGKCSERMDGRADENNGIASRVVISDGRAQDYLRALGAQVVVVPNLLQISGAKLDTRRSGAREIIKPEGEITVLGMEEWAARIKEKKRRLAQETPQK